MRMPLSPNPRDAYGLDTQWRGHCKGFTLLEVLISVAILGIIISALYSTFFLSESAVSANSEYGLRLEEGRQFMDIISGEIRSVLFNWRDSSTLFKLRDRDHFGKPISEVTFSTLGGPDDLLYSVGYFIKEEDGGLALYKRMQAAYSNAEPMEVVVLDRIDSFGIKVRSGKEWTGTWDTDVAKGMPEEVQVTVGIRLNDKVLELSRRVKPVMEVLR